MTATWYKGDEVKNWSDALPLVIVGFYVPLSMLAPTGIGFWIDKRAGHGFPSYTLIGLGIGTVIMAYGVYRMVQPFLREAKGAAKQDETPPVLAKIAMSMSSRQKKNKEDKQ